ncbi:MAG TPA: inositol monophosphatase family protein [Ilumatobacteraceae bacterium]|nr:inositol monophosphatase family protein [Ilumatobacteraceae bacterium]
MHDHHDDHALTELRGLAERLATQAGEEALTGRRRLGVGQPVAHDTKSSPTDPVTEFDRAAEHLIVEELRRHRPDDAIVGEEGAEDPGTSGLAWHIDPIDGTANFVYDLPAWCTSVAVVDASGPLAGAVYVPVTGELFSAARGRGATLNASPIACSIVDDLGRALVGTGFSYSSERRSRQAQRLALLVPRVRDVRRLGSAAIDLCLVASGRLDAYYEEHLNSWDMAAGVLIAAEAGATTTDLFGGVASPESTVAAAPGVHAALLALIAELDR